MPGEIVRRHHALTKAAGDALSTQAVSFETEVFTWAALPARTHRAVRCSAPRVAELAVADDELYRDDKALVQVLRAWRAHTDRIYTVVAARPVTSADRPRPAGPWYQVELRRFDAVGEARRRIGWVPAGVRAPGSGGGAVGPISASPPAAAAPAMRSAAHAWRHLPQAVRQGAERIVPLPEDWLGSLVQTTRPDGFATGHELVVLLRDQSHAVVLHATRDLEPAPGASCDAHDRALAGAQWLVEQVTYSLGAPALLGARRAEVDEWWR